MAETASPPPYPPLRRWRYGLARTIVRGLFRALTRLRVSGLQNLPRSGPILLVSNHLSLVDGPLVFAALPITLRPLVGEKYRDTIFRYLLDSAGSIYVERNRPDRHAMRVATAILADGGTIAVAIEGMRSPTGTLGEGRPGVAYLAKRANVRVLPVAVYGTEKVRRALPRLRRAELHVVVGAAFDLAPGPLDTAQLDQHTTRIMQELAALLPEQYRGRWGAREHNLLGESRG